MPGYIGYNRQYPLRSRPVPISLRVMFVGQGASLLPEDRFVNVFHFHSASGTAGESEYALAHVMVQNFYDLTLSGGNSPGMFLSPYCLRNAQTIVYDLEEPEPRVPHPDPFILDAAIGGGMPEEVAIVVSLHGPPPITARRRGRFYFGPISNADTCVVAGTNAVPSRPAKGSAAHVTQCLLASAQALLDNGQANGLLWSIRSTVPDVNYVPITGGWVDDALDTQRRRGPDPSSRMTFGAT